MENVDRSIGLWISLEQSSSFWLVLALMRQMRQMRQRGNLTQIWLRYLFLLSEHLWIR